MSKEFPSINREATIIYRGHSDNIFTVAWSPDGKYIASGSRDKTVRIWDAATVAPSINRGARFIEGDSLFIYRGHNKCVLSATWSPGHGAYIASGDTTGIVQVWDAFTGSSIVSYHGHTRFVRSVAWSPDGRYIASGGDYGDSTAQVWQAFTGKQIYTHDQQYRIFSVAWAPGLSGPSITRGPTDRGPTWIASSSFDGSVQVWQVPHGNSSEYKLFSYHAHSGPVYALSWSPDGAHIVSGGQDAILRIWNVARSESASGTGSVIRTYNSHTRPVKAVAWSPDGKHIASGGDDMTIQIWEAATARHVATYSGHTSWVRALDWSPDGNRIVSASGNTLHVWMAGLAQVV
jgi:WD40 repeat protein